MAEIIRMPKLGFDMKEGMLIRWVKQEGEAVIKGDVLAEIETDKATVEVEASAEGVLIRQLVEADSIIPIGDPIAVLAQADENVDYEALLGARASKEGTLAPEKGTSESVKESLEPAKPESEPEISPETEGGRIKASPLARKMAADLGIELSGISGTGPDGRIVKQDIENASKTEPAKKAASQPDIEPMKKEVGGSGLPLPIWSGEPGVVQDELVPINKLRGAIGRRMVESKQQVPHFYVTSAYDVAAMLDLRVKVNESLPEDQKLSVNDFIVKAVALTLRQFPNINASLTDKEIIRHGAVNIGVAVSVEGGLLTVVVKDADRKPIRVISNEVKAMAARVRTGKIRSEDVEGSTFSISNLGMFGVENFAAIINPPEAAILAISSAKQEPVVKDGAVVVGWRMKATISADHRITDGAEAAQFMQAMAINIENPLRLLL
ncbi:MAG: hypothetical protein CVU39_18185 [Chloroflexi bacterium HGW-Chloroflexi-10]|nr:MAG: hypothetical protein CVU39_18185 [Chloroflexi bacterium HGW-Chloroflexi-10]